MNRMNINAFMVKSRHQYRKIVHLQGIVKEKRKKKKLV